MFPGRTHLRTRFFQVLRAALRTDDGKSLLTDSLDGLLDTKSPRFTPEQTGSLPYPELGVADEDAVALRDDIVFVTGRFRTGSTLLWNIFRRIDGVTSYYEPFNERRWFDEGNRGGHVDATHRGVDDYWREYENVDGLDEVFRESWAHRNLLMDSDFWDPAMKEYVTRLVRGADSRPVLQFNRLDFRLPWIRRTFPCAKIVHIYRHPRDQWCSTLMDIERFPRNGCLRDFEPKDGFYLLRWARDLRYHFPFLDCSPETHPYRVFYYLWRLSYLFGISYGDISLSFEDLVTRPEAELPRLFGDLGLQGADLDGLGEVISAPRLGKWTEYADDAWFKREEEACERVLRAYFRA